MVDNFSREDVMTYTAQLRAHATAKEKLQLQETMGPRKEDMSLGEALEEVITTMQTDKFWVDLAKPLSAAREALEVGANRVSRQRAAELIRECIKQVAGLKHYFLMEQPVLQNAAALLEDEAQQATLASFLPGVRTTRSPETEAALAKGVEERDKREQKAMQASEGPWHFVEVDNKQDVTVNIAVPASTQKSDISVTFFPSKLRVAVKGHERQPAIIDGELAGKVDPESCSWTLEGSGEKRRLCLELEKTMGGLMWHRLLSISR